MHLNLNSDYGADNFLYQTAIERGAGLLIVSEPWKNSQRRRGDERWSYSTNNRYAISILR